MSTKTKRATPNSANKATGGARKTQAAPAKAAETIAKAGVEATAHAVHNAATVARDHAELASLKTTRKVEEISQAGQSALSGWLESTNTVAEGMGELNRSMLSFVQNSIDANLNIARQMMTCASPQEAMALQASFLKSSFDSVLAESNKVGEIATGTINRAVQPIAREFEDGLGRSFGAFRAPWAA